MPPANGYRARTRHMFKRDFRKHGVIPLSTYMRCCKYGDYVDIVANGAIHKGMPFKGYHGRTGVVFDVTKTAVGVEVNKQVRNRIIKKRIHVKVDHVLPSKCRLQHLNRVKENDAIKRQKGAEKVCLKRIPAQPRPAHFVAPSKPVKTVYVLPYEILA